MYYTKSQIIAVEITGVLNGYEVAALNAMIDFDCDGRVLGSPQS